MSALPDRARLVVLGCHVADAAGRPNRLFTARVAAGAAAYHALAARGDDARDGAEDRPIVLVTQAFHLARSLWLAERLGVDARGLAAAGGIGGPRARAREHLAWLRAAVDTAGA